MKSRLFLPIALTLLALLVACHSGGGAAPTATATAATPPAIASFTLAAPVITVGGNSSLTATFTGGSGSVAPGVGAVQSGVPVTVAPAANTTYTLTVTGPSGATATAQAALTVVPAPVISAFAAVPASLGVGGQAQLTAVFDPGPGGSASLDPALGAPVSGVALATGTLAVSTLFTLTVTNAAGLAVTAQLMLPVGTGALLAGAPSGVGFQDGTGAAAQFNAPFGVAVDAAGNLYIADSGNNTIRRLAPGGVVTTLAGQPGLPGSSDGLGAAAQFSGPRGVALNPAGTVLYVADYGNQTVRQIALPGGAVTTLAGNPGQWGSADGQGNTAHFDFPSGVAVDTAGTIYVADTKNDLIRTVTPAGLVSTLAGSAGQVGALDGKGLAARFSQPIGVAVAGPGTVYVADTGNDTLRVIAADGSVTTLAGAPGLAGSSDGSGAAARFSKPFCLVLDGIGNLRVSDVGNNCIRSVTPAGAVTTVAGTPGGSGSRNGLGPSALFDWPCGLALDGAGNLYLADLSNNQIRAMAPGGLVTTLAGSAGDPDAIDGPGSTARFFNPTGLAVAAGSTVWVADQGNHTIRTIGPDGTVATVAGLAGSPGCIDGAGAIARFRLPAAVAQANGTLFVADAGNSVIRQIDGAGQVTTWVGSPGLTGSSDGATGALFNLPMGLAAAADGSVFVADSGNHTLRRISPDGAVSTLAGSPGMAGSLDGTGAAARFNGPTRLALDAAGDLYVADTGNHLIRKVTPAGVVTTLAGAAGVPGSVDGIGAAARFNQPSGIAVGPTGILYVADAGNATVRQITEGGVVSTIVGQPNQVQLLLGALPGAIPYPADVAVDPATGALLVTIRDAVLELGL